MLPVQCGKVPKNKKNNKIKINHNKYIKKYYIPFHKTF